jgi:predicted dehydrogenase
VRNIFLKEGERGEMVKEKVRWGVLSTAKIGLNKVIPAMQRGRWSTIAAIASRDYKRARDTARELGIPEAYGSYEELLADPDIEAIYNPLPNHLHVPWSVRAAEAGKHVLCEKPISLNMKDALELLQAQQRTGVHIQEAFMVRTHPQWIGTRDLIRDGRIGELRSIAGYFSYFNRDPANIRNVREYGGGALMDIGCYPINISRFIFDEEPARVSGLVERDPEWGVDRLTSAILEFPSGQSVFTCSTQIAAYQRMQFFGTGGLIEVPMPFNAPPDKPCRISILGESGIFGGPIKTKEFKPADQYTIQGDLFSRSIREKAEQPIPLEDAVRNMAVIEAVFRSSESGRWEVPVEF